MAGPQSHPLLSHVPPSPTAAGMTVLETNSLRIAMAAQGLSTFFSTGNPNANVPSLCLTLARGIDYALSNGDVPRVAPCLPSLIKQVYKHNKDQSLQAIFALLMISIKNASRSGWFQAADADELLRIGNELFGSFCTSASIRIEVSNALNTLSMIMSRFYSRFSLGDLIVSVEAKPGYETLMTDFNIKKDRPPEQKIGLFVVRTDELETSSCLVSPPQVSFLVNGKGVARRTNVSLDNGPQLPSDITKMLKYGMNILQAIGNFNGNYIIAVAFISNVPSSDRSIVKDYVQPAVAAQSHDYELIEGPSRISLNCPISFRRINTPVKGHLCKHPQCFDYENYVEINSRKPSWRCPCCNQPTSFVDLRIDQNMVKILQDVKDDITDVLISADGSWKVVIENNRSTDQQKNEKHSEKQVSETDGQSKSISNTSENVVDLCMDEDGGSDQNSYETDRKPFKNSQELLSEQPLAHHAFITNRTGNDVYPRAWSSPSVSHGSVPATTLDSHRVGTLESLVPTGVLNPLITDAISPSLGQSSLQVNQPVSTYQNVSHIRQLVDNMQMLQSQFGNPIVSSETERQLITRQVNRDPVAIQAFAGLNQASSSSGITTIGGDTAVRHVSRAEDIVPLQQHHSVIENLGEGREYQLNSALQQTMAPDQQRLGSYRAPMPADQQRLGGYRAPMPADQQRLGGYRAPMPPPTLDNQILHHLMPNLRGSQAMIQCTNTPLSSSSPSVHIQHASQNAAGTAAGSLISQNDQLSAVQRAQLSSLRSVYPSQFLPGSSIAMMTDSSRIMGVEQFHNMPGVPMETSRGEGLPELPSDQNWQPTGRMRGSLTGHDYSAALHRYIHPSQQLPARPSTSEQLPVPHFQQVRHRFNHLHN